MTYGHAISSTANNANPTAGAQLAPPVHAAMASLGDANARLYERLQALTQRLDSVLNPLPPASVGESASKTARHSLALQIESEAGKVNEAADRVDSLISRLEV